MEIITHRSRVSEFIYIYLFSIMCECAYVHVCVYIHELMHITRIHCFFTTSPLQRLFFVLFNILLSFFLHRITQTPFYKEYVKKIIRIFRDTKKIIGGTLVERKVEVVDFKNESRFIFKNHIDVVLCESCFTKFVLQA